MYLTFGCVFFKTGKPPPKPENMCVVIFKLKNESHVKSQPTLHLLQLTYQVILSQCPCPLPQEILRVLWLAGVKTLWDSARAYARASGDLWVAALEGF